MAKNVPNRDIFFDCANSIELWRCFHCANFETHDLAHLKHHFNKGGHTFLEWKEELYTSKCCNFQTHSKFLSVRHKLLNPCMRNVQVRSAAPVQEENRNPGESVDDLRKCQYCPYRTKHSSNLNRHILAKHTDAEKIQWFECAQCLYKCKRISHLRNHTNNKHNSEKHLRCDRCPFETKHKNSLKGHILSKHTRFEEIRWFQCAQCPYRSNMKANLKQHVGNRHGVRKYLKCDRCPYEAKYKRSLNDHVLTKHTEFPKIRWFRCTKCAYKCKPRYDLKKHMERMHDG